MTYSDGTKLVLKSAIKIVQFGKLSMPTLLMSCLASATDSVEIKSTVYIEHPKKNNPDVQNNEYIYARMGLPASVGNPIYH